MMTGISGITRFRTRVASRPFTGIERSSRIKSGCKYARILQQQPKLGWATIPFRQAVQKETSSDEKPQRQQCPTARQIYPPEGFEIGHLASSPRSVVVSLITWPRFE